MNFASTIPANCRSAAVIVLATLAATCAASSAPPPVSYPPGTHLRSDRPHPAVARVIVPEGNATSYGSGTLVDVRNQFGLVITNWHVVRDGQGDVEVVFPDGFRSMARPLKVDADWDLAALVIWRPPTPPVAIAVDAPQSGDQLTICGYGQGAYRAVTGRCTQYYAPKVDLPQHMVELDVEARQGDSGGPIFNDRGELAGVLFGAGGGTTLGSFGGRVESFLATLAPDIGRAADNALVQATVAPVATPLESPIAEPPAAVVQGSADAAALWTEAGGQVAAVDAAGWSAATHDAAAEPAVFAAQSAARHGQFEHVKTTLAIVGVVALLFHVLRAVR